MRSLKQKGLSLNAEYDEEGVGGFGISEVTVTIPGDEANVFYVASKADVAHAKDDLVKRVAEMLDDLPREIAADVVNEAWPREKQLIGIKFLLLLNWVLTMGIIAYFILWGQP